MRPRRLAKAAMDTGQPPNRKQFKAPTASKRRRKPPAGKRTKHKAPEEQEPVDPQLLASPRSKAVCPYTPSTDVEDYHLRSLINYCKSRCSHGWARLTNMADVTFVTAATLTNVGPRFEWYGLAVRDEAFFHALMSSTCAHYTYMTGVQFPYRWIFFRHRGEAIRMVNQRIVQGRHDEGTINAIIVFAQQDVGAPDRLDRGMLTAFRVLKITRRSRNATWMASSVSCKQQAPRPLQNSAKRLAGICTCKFQLAKCLYTQIDQKVWTWRPP